jgi:transcription antitermination factor NusG
MEHLRSLCDGDIFRKTEVEKSGFRYGQKVTPQTGPFAFHVGRYEGKTKRHETALFVLFGREQKVKFKRGELVAAA